MKQLLIQRGTIKAVIDRQITSSLKKHTDIKQGDKFEIIALHPTGVMRVSKAVCNRLTTVHLDDTTAKIDGANPRLLDLIEDFNSFRRDIKKHHGFPFDGVIVEWDLA